jgi:hypothetical protein
MTSPSRKRIGGPIIRFEPEGVSLSESYPKCSQVFKERGWYEYCSNLVGHHPAVTKVFAKSFDGKKVEFKSLTLWVTEEAIAEAT